MAAQSIFEFTSVMVGGGGGECDVIFNITEGGLELIFFVLEGGYCLRFCQITLVFQPPPLLLIIAQSLKHLLSNDQSNTCAAGTTRFVNASCSDVITVPLFFSPPSPYSYNPRRPPPRYI